MNNSELYAFIQGTWHRTEITKSGDNQVIYAGKCSSREGDETLPIWCIKRVTITTAGNTQTIVEEFADGNLKYDNVWADRANLTYKYNI